MSLSNDVNEYLQKEFPGSTLHDGYNFVRFKAPEHRGTRLGSTQAVVDALGGARWLIVVGADPRPFAVGSRFEAVDFVYSPDYNIREPVDEWLVEVQGRVEFDKIAASLPSISALAAISTECDVAFHASLARVYSPSADTLNGLAKAHPHLFSEGIDTIQITGEEAWRLHERLAREQQERRARRLADERAKAQATGKEPFDFVKLRALGVDVTVEGRVTDPAQQQDRFEEMYYVQFPWLQTLAELAEKEAELAA